MSNNVDWTLYGVDRECYPDVVHQIEFLRTEHSNGEGVAFRWIPETGCWSMVDKEAGFKRFQKLLEEMQDTPRTGPVEHHWTREELHERG